MKEGCMRVASAVESAAGAVSSLRDGDEVVIWDTTTGAARHLPSPARGLETGRRLAVLDVLLAEQVEVVCAVPLGFCTASYAIARAMDLRFIPLELGAPVATLRHHLDALLLTAQAELPGSWLAPPAGRPEGGAPVRSLVLPIADITAQALINRLKRLEGQARGAQRLIAERRDCVEIAMQLGAMRAALNAVTTTLLAENLAACVAREQGDEQGATEAAKQLFRYLT
jgi:DNA-binding FrmR family transcriptional regulator